MSRAVLRACALMAFVMAGGPARPVAAAPESVKAAVFRSTGTQWLGQTIWRELNAQWSLFGNVPVEIDYTSLASYRITLEQLDATEANVIIMSAPGYATYTEAEIDALIDYVEAGHGLIYTYGLFRSEDRRLAPLVGLSSGVQCQANTWPNPYSYNVLVPDHPVFEGITGDYPTGIPYLASAQPLGVGEWPVTTGQILARARPTFDQWTGNGIILANDPGTYRGLYFAHYIEDKSGGADQEDMQVFYNGLLWTAGVPEPGTCLMMLTGAAFLTRRRGRR
jgi:hypothetical protein